MDVQLRRHNVTDRLIRYSQLAGIVSAILFLAAETIQTYANETISSGTTTEVSGGSEPQIGVRVISTRTCPQDGYSLCSPEHYDYYRLDDNSQWQSSDLKEFLNSLNPENPVAFFVHGNLVTWETAFQEGWLAANAMRSAAPRNSKLTVVMFTWESDRQSPLPSIDVEIKASRADTTGFYLARLLRKLPSDMRASLVGHSHGARSIAGALQLLSGGTVADRALPAPYSADVLPALRAVFLAGTLDHNSLAPGKDYDRVLTSAKAVLNVRNSKDSILALYPLRMPFAESAIGKVGLRDRDWRRLGQNQSRIQQLDAAEIIGNSHDWVSYFQAPTINAAIAQYVHFKE